MGVKLIIVAVTGVVVSAMALTGAFALSGGEFPSIDGDSLGWSSSRRCQFDEKAPAGNRKIDWSGTDRVEIDVPASVHYRRGVGEQLEISGDPRVLANIEVKENKIRLNCSLRSFHKPNLRITLPGQTFRELKLNGAGEMFLDDLDQGDLTISMAGAGEVHANGKASNVNLSIVGAGDADLKRLAVKDVDISMVGAGSAEVAPEGDAHISIVGAGSVRLETEPKNLSTNIIGAGDITHARR